MPQVSNSTVEYRPARKTLQACKMYKRFVKDVTSSVPVSKPIRLSCVSIFLLPSVFCAWVEPPNIHHCKHIDYLSIHIHRLPKYALGRA